MNHKALLPAGSPLMSCFPFNSLISASPAGLPRLPGATFPAQGHSATCGPDLTKGNLWPVLFSCIADRNLIVPVPLSIVVSRYRHPVLHSCLTRGLSKLVHSPTGSSGGKREAFTCMIHALGADSGHVFVCFHLLLTITAFLLCTFRYQREIVGIGTTPGSEQLLILYFASGGNFCDENGERPFQNWTLKNKPISLIK